MYVYYMSKTRQRRPPAQAQTHVQEKKKKPGTAEFDAAAPGGVRRKDG